jgi:hypothetical protein
MDKHNTLFTNINFIYLSSFNTYSILDKSTRVIPTLFTTDSSFFYFFSLFKKQTFYPNVSDEFPRYGILTLIKCNLYKINGPFVLIVMIQIFSIYHHYSRCFLLLRNMIKGLLLDVYLFSTINWVISIFLLASILNAMTFHLI